MRVFPVSIGGKLYSVNFQTLQEFQKGWRSVLAQAHGGIAICVCRPLEDGARKLSIKYVKATDHYHLARFRDTEEQHHPECCFAISYPEGEKQQNDNQECSAAVRTSNDGVDVSFHLGLSTATQTQSRSRSEQAAPIPRKKRTTLKSLELLYLIWEKAGLTVWLPSFAGKRNYFTAFYRIANESQKITINGVPLANVLLLQTTLKNESASHRNSVLTHSAIKNQQKLFVISKLARYKPNKHENYPSNMPIIGYFGMPWINVSPELWRRTEEACQLAYDAWVAGKDVIAIALIEPKTKASSSALEIALMEVTEELLPVQMQGKQQGLSGR